MAFAPTYYALVNTGDGIITGHGVTTEDQPGVPQGATVISADQYATVEAAAADLLQCRLLGGVVRLRPALVPAPVDLTAIQASAYVQIDTAAEQARTAFLTPGSGQALEYQETAADAERLLAVLGFDGAGVTGVTGTIAATTAPPRSGTEEPGPPAATPPATPAPVIDPADYPWLVAEQQALAAIGVVVSLHQVALSVHQTMQGWQQAGAAIKRIRRQAKLEVSQATTGEQIAAILSAIAWPQRTDLAAQGAMAGT